MRPMAGQDARSVRYVNGPVSRRDRRTTDAAFAENDSPLKLKGFVR
jgi:hypothetical protein